MTPSKLDGVDAVVTGASRGLGFGFARVLAEAGARVWMVAEIADELHEAVSEVVADGGKVEFRVVDLADRSAVSELVIDIRSKTPRLEVLVNNAAVLERAPLTEMDLSLWDTTLAVNLTAPMMLCQGLLPGLLRGGGSIINVSSRAGRIPFERQTAYGASKFALEGFTQCLALELAGTSVSVNTVTPGLRLKPTSLTRADVEHITPEERDRWNDPGTLAPAMRFVSALRGNPSGIHMDLHEVTRTIEAHGTDHLLRDLSELDDGVNR